MNKRKYLSVVSQHYLGRVGARLLVSLVATFVAILLKSTLVQAATTARMEDLGGTWVMTGVPGGNDLFTVRMRSQRERILLTLPEAQIRLASGQDVVLTPCDTRTYCSQQDFSPTVRFELTSKNRADLSIKGADAQGIAYLDVPLRRDIGD